MSDAFFSRFPAAHRAAHASALPGSSISTDHLGNTTVTLPRTFEPARPMSDRSPSNIISWSSPFSNVFFSTFREPQKKILDNRTVLIAVNGACSGNGTPAAHAGVGIFFGPNSPHNVSETISGAQTSQRAEIIAATKVLRKASALLQDVITIGCVVLLSDSQYVVGAMTEWIFAWKENGWKDARGGPVQNKAEFQELDALIEQLEEDGLDVKVWLVGRENNAQADELAKAACN
ncbi:ribonuclease H-like domain-containing protein [Mycena maculata]|uniref:ribonuclease H n=1 Tax=Mycena maculata TaxID=230809 RepID=A0AAD7NJS0_9AGAR|nr:ribonuclease H-like domain-containing protein [Mycena maculata]